MSRWFRMYDDLLDDPKVQRLDPVLFKTWVNLLCLASRNDGKLPSVSDTAFSLRVSDEVAASQMEALYEKGLIDLCEFDYSPHNWDKRQYKSDRDDTAAERQRRKRDKGKAETVTTENVTRDITETSQPPDTDTEVIRLDGAIDSKPVDQFAVLEKQMREAAGWEREPHPNLAVIGPVAAILTMGVDLDQDLLPACRTHGPRLTSRTSWKYILQAAISNRDNRLNALKDASKPSQPSNGYPHAPRSKPNSIADSFAAFDAAIADRERELAARENSAGIGNEGIRLVS